MNTCVSPTSYVCSCASIVDGGGAGGDEVGVVTIGLGVEEGKNLHSKGACTNFFAVRHLYHGLCRPLPRGTWVCELEIGLSKIRT